VFWRRKRATELAELYAADLEAFCSSYGLTEEEPGPLSKLVPASLTLARWEPDEFFNARQWRLTLSDGSDARFVQAARQHAEYNANYSTLQTQYIEMVAMDVPECTGFVSRLIIAPSGEQDTASRGFYGGGTMASSLWPRGNRDLELENGEVRKRYDIRVSRDADDAWLRRLFGPALADLIASGSETRWFYELVDGKLAVFAVNWLAPVPPPKLGGLIETAGSFAGHIRQACAESPLAS
jgi:hypothetical protein